MPISSMLLEIDAARERELLEHLRAVPGVGVHAAQAGNVVITTDTNSAGEDRKLTDYIGALPGVHSAHVVFSSMEDIIEGAAVSAGMESGAGAGS